MKAPIWLLLLLAWNADACQCIHQELAENFPAAEAVVVGQAVASANFCNLTNQKCSGGPGVSLLLRKAVFKDETPVERVYLGSKKLCILDSGTNCDFHFVAGKHYVVFGYAVDSNSLSTSTCSGTFEYGSSPARVAAVRALAEAYFKAKQSPKTDPFAPQPLSDGADGGAA